MIQTYAHQKKLPEARLNLKTIEGMFINLITEGTNCPLFVAVKQDITERQEQQEALAAKPEAVIKHA